MKILLLCFCFLGTGISLSIHEECLAKPSEETELEWKGSHIDITAWNPSREESERNDEFKSILSLTLVYSEKIGKDDFARILIGSSGVKITPDGGNIMNFTNQIEDGWTDFNFTAEKQYEIWHKQSFQRLVSLPKDKKIQKLYVVGKSVTINCHLPKIGWYISKDETKTIPLNWHDQIHKLSLFSNEEIKPTIGLGNQAVQVGWDGNDLVDITKTKEEFQEPLPSSHEHWLSLHCKENENVCFLQGNRVLKTFEYSKDSLPSSLSVTSDKNMYIYFHRQYPQKSSTTMPPITNANPDQKSAGHVAAIAVFVLICVGLTGAVVFLLRRKNKKLEDQIRNTVEEAVKPLLPSNSSTISDEAQLEPKMWNAVVENDARYVEFLLSRGYSPDNPEKNRPTTPFYEAHILGRYDILQVIAHSRKEEVTMPPNDLIIKVMNEMTRRMKKIFKSAAHGMYKQEQGVKLLLLGQSVPGTIRDQEGQSLLHYMASKSFMDGRPAWEAQDIEDFLRNHEYYINAIDHRGNTALHSLAMRRREEEKVVFWQGREQTLSDAWLALAEVLLSHGCDPRIPNHQGLLPHQLATDKRNHDLAKLFQRKCDALGKIDLKNEMKNYPKLVTAAQKGDTKQIRSLLLNHVPLLPMGAHSDPLVEAIRHRQRDAVFLLLCAGSPLCNRSIEDLTPLETAHSTLGIPACFPALMRKAYRDRLQSETSRVSEKDESLKLLREGMQQVMKRIEKEGSQSRWTFTQTDDTLRSREARRLLVQAAELGLSLTCQLLGLEDVILHPFSDEEKPFKMAIKNKHVDTQYVLYRDLNMSPHIFPSSLKMISPIILEHRWVSALLLLEEICSNKKLAEICGEPGTLVLQYFKTLTEKEGLWKEELMDDPLQDPPALLLYILSRYGLDTILHTLLKKCRDLSINTIVKPFSNSTLIHVASMYGQHNMIEYLIYNGANLNLTTIGEFSPAHLAALKGHRECMQYILAYMESQGKDVGVICNLGYTAQELMGIYEKMCNKSSFPLLNHMDALHIKSRKESGDQAYELLKRKSKLLNISNKESLLECATTKNVSKNEIDEIQQDVLEMAKHVCKQIDDPRFQGEIRPVGHLLEGHDIFQITDSRVIYELSEFHAVGSSATVKCKEVVNDHNETSIEIISDEQPNLFDGITFRDTFRSIIEKIVAKNGELVPGIVMIPPFVTTFSEGVTIYSVWTRRNDIRFMRTKIVPCLRAEIPPSSRLKTLPHNFNGFLREDCVHLLLKNIQGKWLYRDFNSENSIWSSLNESQKTVWLSCRLILVLLKKVWWSPIFNNKRYEKSWHTMSLGVTPPEERAIKALFLKEMAECNDWNESAVFDRVYATFKRAAEKDEHNQWIPKRSVSSFLTPRHYSSIMSESIVGIMHFLDDFKTVQNSTPKVQIRTEKEVSSTVTFRS